MALLECPDCAREVSDAATSCPGCGRTIQSAPVVTRRRGTVYEAVGALLIFSGVGGCSIMSIVGAQGGVAVGATLGTVGFIVFMVGRFK